ncbi:MAG TPA: hypothetical protein VN328_09090 [Thermodesulfovibrionales bacterium]|nr:hypothetical protein [Thermodesulfovibrionales bacterium]
MMIVALFAIPVSAEEPRAYTEEDLEKYKTLSTYDEETIRQSEENIEKWEREKRIGDKIESDKREADDKSVTEQKQTSTKKSAAIQTTIKDPDNSSPQSVKKRKT